MILSVRAYRPTWERLQGFLVFLCVDLSGTMPLGRSRCLDPLPQDLGRLLVTGSMGGAISQHGATHDVFGIIQNVWMRRLEWT